MRVSFLVELSFQGIISHYFQAVVKNAKWLAAVRRVREGRRPADISLEERGYLGVVLVRTRDDHTDD